MVRELNDYILSYRLNDSMTVYLVLQPGKNQMPNFTRDPISAHRFATEDVALLARDYYMREIQCSSKFSDKVKKEFMNIIRELKPVHIVGEVNYDLHYDKEI